jgi:hypothetical protein
MPLLRTIFFQLSGNGLERKFYPGYLTYLHLPAMQTTKVKVKLFAGFARQNPLIHIPPTYQLSTPHVINSHT